MAQEMCIRDSKGDIDAYIELKNGEILLYGGRNEIANRALGSVLNLSLIHI